MIAIPARSLPGPAFVASLASITVIGPLAIHTFLPVMPVVRDSFGVADGQVGLLFSVTLFVVAFATLAYGSLSDRYGRRPALLSGLALFFAGTVLCALATSFAMLAAGRVVQAVGAGCSAGLTRAIARDAYGNDGLVKIIAYLTMAYTLGPMIAPFIGGMLMDAHGWRAVFWFMAATGAAVGLAAWRVLPETHTQREGRADGGGVVRDYVQLFSHLRFAAFVLQSGGSSATFFAMSTAAAFLMKDYLGRSATEFGLWFMIFPVGYFLGNVVSSRLSGRVPIETMVLVGSLINVVAVLAQAICVLADYVTPLVLVLPGCIVTFGQGIALPNAQVGALRVVPRLGGTAAGVGVFLQMFLGAAAAQLYTLVSDGTPLPLLFAVGLASVLTITAGTIPFVLERRASARRSKPGTSAS